MTKKINGEIRPGEPIYLLKRNGRLVSSETNTVKIFSGPEHLNWYRRRYTTRILPSDKLIKYVPAPEEGQETKEDL